MGEREAFPLLPCYCGKPPRYWSGSPSILASIECGEPRCRPLTVTALTLAEAAARWNFDRGMAALGRVQPTPTAPVAAGPELLPCPFCGNDKAPGITHSDGDAFVACYGIRGGCGARGEAIANDDPMCEREAVAAWNRRSADIQEVLDGRLAPKGQQCEVDDDGRCPLPAAVRSHDTWVCQEHFDSHGCACRVPSPPIQGESDIVQAIYEAGQRYAAGALKPAEFWQAIRALMEKR